MRFVLGFALIALGLSGAVPVAAQSADWGSVVQVVDAATLDVDMGGTIERVRLLGIEDGTGSAQAPSAACGAASAASRAHELAGGQMVRLEADPAFAETDEAGRKSAYVWLSDGRDLGEVLLREGLVRTQLTDRAFAYEANYANAQLTAATEGVGSWAPDACPAADSSQAMATFLVSMLDQAQAVSTTANVLHQQAVSADSYAPALSQAAWRQGTEYALAQMRKSARVMQSVSAPAAVQPLSQRLAVLGNDLAAGADAYSVAVDNNDLAQLAASDTQLQAASASLQPLMQELIALAGAYKLED
jgi:endonuclease YncB( thermonuclease family)